MRFEMKKKYANFTEEAQKRLKPKNIKRAKKKAEELILKYKLSEIRKKQCLTQKELKFSQSSVSKIEKRTAVTIKLI